MRNLTEAMALLFLLAASSTAFLQMRRILAISSSGVRFHTNPVIKSLNVISKDDSDEDELEFMYETGFTKRKKGAGWKKTDNRDSLPFVVSSNSNDGKLKEIGTYLLDSSTGCGDLLDLSGNIFLVNRVSYLYKYESGGFRVFKKKLDVTSTKASWSDSVVADKNQQFLQ